MMEDGFVAAHVRVLSSDRPGYGHLSMITEIPRVVTDLGDAF